MFFLFPCIGITHEMQTGEGGRGENHPHFPSAGERADTRNPCKRACSWRKRKPERAVRLTGGCIYCLSAERLPRSAAGVPPPAPRARRATARLPQPPGPLQPPLAPGAEQEPRASASARPARGGGRKRVITRGHSAPPGSLRAEFAAPRRGRSVQPGCSVHGGRGTRGTEPSSRGSRSPAACTGEQGAQATVLRRGGQSFPTCGTGRRGWGDRAGEAVPRACSGPRLSVHGGGTGWDAPAVPAIPTGSRDRPARRELGQIVSLMKPLQLFISSWQ